VVNIRNMTYSWILAERLPTAIAIKQSSSSINGKTHIISRSLFTEAEHTNVTFLGQGCTTWCVIFKVKYNLVHLAALSTRVVKNNSQTGVAATIITPTNTIVGKPGAHQSSDASSILKYFGWQRRVSQISKRRAFQSLWYYYTRDRGNGGRARAGWEI